MKMKRLPGMLTVFVTQESVATEAEAEKILTDARSNDATCVGGRVLAPARAQRTSKKWLVETYFQDQGGTPPMGMARLCLPQGTDLTAYGLS